MKILVTGGNGFLGKPVVDYLLKERHEVVVLDVVMSNLRPHPKLKVVLGSMEAKEKTEEATEGIDAVYHLALNYCEDLSEFFTSNIKGTVNLLQSAKQNRVKHFLYCSSSAVYGTQAPEYPVDETRSCYPEEVDVSKMPSGIPEGAKLGYGILKFALEKLCIAFGENHNLPVTILRVVGGFGGKHNGVKPPGYGIIKRAQNNEIIKIERGSTITTSFVEDVARGFLLATLNPKAYNEVFNLFSFSYSKKELAEFVVKTTDSKSLIKEISLRGPLFNYSMEKIKTILGYQPKGKPIDLEKCLKGYIKKNQ